MPRGWVFTASAHAFVWLLCVGAAFGQPRHQIVEDNPWFVRGGFEPGFVLPTSDFLSGANAAGQPIRWSPNATIEIGRQTDGSRLWHHFYHFPAYGLGFSSAWFSDARELGQPLEVYGFVSWPIGHIFDNLELTTDFSTGLSWRWRPYNETTNPFDTIIGSNVNVRFDWGFYARYIITPRLSLYGGLDFTHRSNGELLQPNDGINVIGPRFNVRYNLSDQRHEPVLIMLPPLPAFHPEWEMVIGGTAGLKNVLEQSHPTIRQDFRTGTMTFAVQRHFYRFGKAAAGVELTYDGAVGARLDLATRAAPSERWTTGVYGGYEHIIARFSVIAQVGYVVARPLDEPGITRVYERYGWRYRIMDRLSTTIGMRLINVFNATQVEVGVA
ncbi:MAG TPA: acyloxyacyl hydrolase, partial [Vicinamibacterales bacterium]|nr:acyloxyacyl hydrolase [Vicinamibacterales bacterium]